MQHAGATAWVVVLVAVVDSGPGAEHVGSAAGSAEQVADETGNATAVRLDGTLARSAADRAGTCDDATDIEEEEADVRMHAQSCWMPGD